MDDAKTPRDQDHKYIVLDKKTKLVRNILLKYQRTSDDPWNILHFSLMVWMRSHSEGKTMDNHNNYTQSKQVSKFIRMISSSSMDELNRQAQKASCLILSMSMDEVEMYYQWESVSYDHKIPSATESPPPTQSVMVSMIE
jgi:hypothetical protein